MQPLLFESITVDEIALPILKEKNVRLTVLRLDKIHPVISGNKWFKLKYYLEEASELKKKKIVTFGGAWSNHIVATAAACQLNGFDATGIIRGEESAMLLPTLRKAKEMGMQLIFINRGDYKMKILPSQFSTEEYYLIPEGGYGRKGTEGAAEILDNCNKEIYTHIACAAGTGTMLAGLIMSSLPHQNVTGISVLKNNNELEENVKLLLNNDPANFQIIHDYHFGGYAKYTKELLNFMNGFYRQTSIPSDFVYTGKLFFAVTDLARKNYFPSGSRLLIVHSGGLQGNASLDKRELIF